MNRQIVKLFGLILVLYALLFGFTSYWSVFDSSSLKANMANRRPLLEEQTDPPRRHPRRRRLRDRALDGGGQGQRQDLRPPLSARLPVRQPDRLQLRRPRPGRLRASHNDELVGNKTEFLSILDELQGHAQVGDKVQSSLDPAAQRAAVEGLAGAAARWWRSSRPPARSGRWSTSPSTTRTVQNATRSSGSTPRQRAALQPRDPGRLPARLDDEGGDGDGCARQRRLHPELGVSGRSPM